MEWRWDQRKAVANKAKHGVSFELAALVFADPLHLSQLDSHPDGNRWQTIGRVSTATLLVVHTYFDDESGGRIISARKATAYERHAYEEGI
ncbi:MAG: BrnT family toxin [Sphingomonadales bacterium]|nr:BrnT family toxin [Sphingomonadales bacterium]PIX65151.1 MAG: hypothetical protein COZ43_10160 [Sphingomonadales bacterium CG_4_10_14_3_um_filter_58_15]NCO49030.1 BrnT family toxin [Sphingomonadales bacterium]NCP00841.1 BrnT family toxin [Sphingomonadales bacterium]NCP26205.1 BrnT family toxin [Sphingomonadales bacterium]